MAKYSRDVLLDCKAAEIVYRKFLAIYVQNINDSDASCIVRGVQQMSRKNHKMVNGRLIKSDKSFADLK